MNYKWRIIFFVIFNLDIESDGNNNVSANKKRFSASSIPMEHNSYINKFYKYEYIILVSSKDFILKIVFYRSQDDKNDEAKKEMSEADKRQMVEVLAQAESKI